MHEVGHAIGFWHEQSRPDRDQYIDIIWNNIENDISSRYQFKQRTHQEVNSRGSEYDYDSIMHYEKTAFGKEENCIFSACLS